jgi:hypothetical protein
VTRMNQIKAAHSFRNTGKISEFILNAFNLITLGNLRSSVLDPLTFIIIIIIPIIINIYALVDIIIIVIIIIIIIYGISLCMLST